MDGTHRAIFSGPSILFTIGGHGAEQNWKTVQTIDLSGEERNCFQPKEFPWQLEDGQGFTGSFILKYAQCHSTWKIVLSQVHGEPVVCGGLRELGENRTFVKNCTIYDHINDEWEFLANTQEERTYAGIIQLDEGSFWITGKRLILVWCFTPLMMLFCSRWFWWRSQPSNYHRNIFQWGILPWPRLARAIDLPLHGSAQWNSYLSDWGLGW